MDPVPALEWRHMNIMASQMSGNSAAYSTACSGKHERPAKLPITGPLWGESTSDWWILIGGFPSQRASNGEIISRHANDVIMSETTLQCACLIGYTVLINLWMRPANERRRYIVTSSLIGWVHSQNYPWYSSKHVKAESSTTQYANQDTSSYYQST